VGGARLALDDRRLAGVLGVVEVQFPRRQVASHSMLALMASWSLGEKGWS
jgi:hypothetical protein